MTNPTHYKGQLAYFLTPGYHINQMSVYLVECLAFFTNDGPETHPSKRGPKVNYRKLKFLWSYREGYSSINLPSPVYCAKESQLAFTDEQLQSQIQQALEKYKIDTEALIQIDNSNIYTLKQKLEAYQNNLKAYENDLTNINSFTPPTLSLTA